MDGYATTGFYANNQPGEIFLRVGKAGSFVEGIFGVVAIEASQMLQYGIPLNKILEKWDHITFDQADLLRSFATSIRSHVAEVGGNPDVGYTVPTQDPTQCNAPNSSSESRTMSS